MKNPRKVGQLDIDLGQKLKDWRKASGITQSNLAAHLGVSAQQIGKYERGQNRIGQIRYAQALAFIADPRRRGGFAETASPYDHTLQSGEAAQRRREKIKALLNRILKLL